MENTKDYSVYSKVDFGNPGRGGEENHFKRCLKGVQGGDGTTGGGGVDLS